MEVYEEMMRGVPIVVSMNGDIREKKSRWAFVPISVSVRWAFVPVPVQVYPKEKITHFLCRQELELYFRGRCFTDVIQSVHD